MKEKQSNFSIGKFLTEWGAVLAIIITFLIFSVTAKGLFLSTDNMITILRSISITTIIAIGATFAFSAGFFDLSLGSIATLAAAFSCTFIAWYGMPMWVAIIATFAICMLIGCFNSFVSFKMNVPTFLTTLAMSFILDGFELTYSGGSIINPRMNGAAGQQLVKEIPSVFFQFGKAPWIIIIMLVCVAICEFFQGYTKHGRFMYMVGSNAEAARLSGINVNFYRTLAFMLTGLFVSVGGVLIVSRAGTVSSNAGSAFLMPAIAAVNIGAALAGRGKPNAIGTFVGAALIGVVENGLYALSFPYYAINIVKGAILLIALIMSNYANKEH